MKKTFFILIFVSLLLVSFVFSQPFPFEQRGNLGLTISFPPYAFYEKDKEIVFNFHVYNTTTGKVLTNDTISCIFHLFDKTGDHILNQINVPFDGTGIDWELNVSGSNFSTEGAYSFLVNCNSSDAGGFDLHSFTITESGIAEKTNMFTILIGIIAIMLFFGGMGYFTKLSNIKSFAYGLSLIQLVNLVFILYISEAGGSLIPILRINFWSISILAFGIGMIGLIRWTVRLINPEDVEEDEKKKWER